MTNFDIENWERKNKDMPNEYFENMQFSVINKIKESKNKSKVIGIKIKTLYWSAACVIIFLGVGSYFNFKKSTLISVKNKTAKKEINLNKDNFKNNKETIVNIINLPKSEPTQIKDSAIKLTEKSDSKIKKLEVLTDNKKVEKNLDDLLTSYSDEDLELLKNEYDEEIFSISE